MKPPIEKIAELCPGLDNSVIQQHLDRLDEDYFNRFTPEHVAEHLCALAELSAQSPVRVLLNEQEGRVGCTVLSLDLPGIFSLITGVLAAMGLNIDTGNVFTYQRSQERSRPTRRFMGRPGRRRAMGLRSTRRIIDFFEGWRDTDQPFERWSATLRNRLQTVIVQLVQGHPQSDARARKRVNEMVTRRLSQMPSSEESVLYPVRVEVDEQVGESTRVRVISQDTPAFLYAFSTALSLNGLSIERVRIHTVDERIEDEIDFVDAAGNPVRDPQTLNKVKLSVLLTKQFTYFLSRAPDPYAALSRFEQLTNDILRLPEGGQWVEQLSDPRMMQDLARLLGASDFLWEDFIRTQYEALLPILKPHMEGRHFSESMQTLPQRLEQALCEAQGPDAKRQALNRFKDREIFLIDLDHILTPSIDFRLLSERLTALAEVVVRKAAQLVYDKTAAEFGHPRTEDGTQARWAVFGLGKLGGAALGYASDIELLFVYDRNGTTDGRREIDNARFFERMVSEVSHFIEAKREGIFQVDLRLRPYGKNAPLACSEEAFKRYYQSDGPAHAMERLALVRLRAIGGDAQLGREIEQLRDALSFDPTLLDLEALREARSRQYQQKGASKGRNAKYGCGALVDVEYAVQILQVRHARESPRLRTPRIHEAIEALAQTGVLGRAEGERLHRAYNFLRRLINGLRMLRGSALDLFLPAFDSDEFAHLARRTGYKKQGRLEATDQLRVSWETHTATVRLFIQNRLGPRMLPDPGVATVADLVLSGDVANEPARRVLEATGFRDTAAAKANLHQIAGGAGEAEQAARLMVFAEEIFASVPDPDRALSQWARFTAALPEKERHYRTMAQHPRLLEVLLKVLTRSQMLAELLIREPRIVQWLQAPHQMLEDEPIDAIEHHLSVMIENRTQHPTSV